jgi:hypothetical protein
VGGNGPSFGNNAGVNWLRDLNIGYAGSLLCSSTAGFVYTGRAVWLHCLAVAEGSAKILEGSLKSVYQIQKFWL